MVWPLIPNPIRRQKNFNHFKLNDETPRDVPDEISDVNIFMTKFRLPLCKLSEQFMDATRHSNKDLLKQIFFNFDHCVF